MSEAKEKQRVTSSVSIPLLLTVTWFGSGLSPRAPGTIGSVAALPFAWGLWHLAPSGYESLTLCCAAMAVFCVGWWAAARYEALTGEHDLGMIVIDEVAAQWLVVAIAPPSLLSYALGFLFFRLADIFKPWPVSWADRKISGGLGVMLDDLFAAGYAVLALWGALTLFS